MPGIVLLTDGGDYDQEVIPAYIWLSWSKPSHCLHVATFINDDGPRISSETFLIMAMQGKLVVQVNIVEQCLEGAVRLTGGRDSSEGRVEVCHHGVYATVCNNLWTMRNGHVVCNQLGLQGKLMAVL